MDYTKHMTATQTEQADPRQKKNNAGGYSFEVSKLQQFERFLILGSEGGTYYVKERELTRDNAQNVLQCIASNPKECAETLRNVSVSGRAPKQSPALFALALMCSHPSQDARVQGWSIFQDVCRTGTHLFEFVTNMKKLGRLNGRRARRALSSWYVGADPEKLTYQLAKYRQRGGMSHRDVLRLCHANAGQIQELQRVLRWSVTGPTGMAERTVKYKNGKERTFQALDLPEYLLAFEELQHADLKRTLTLIEQYKFTHEMVKTEHKKSPELWSALLPTMPLTAMIRNLGVMGAAGILGPLSAGSQLVRKKLEGVLKAKVHPLAVLSALKVYEQGHGEKGSLRWDPNMTLVSALDDAFYVAFGSIESVGKPLVLGIDISGSMSDNKIAGIPGINARTASAVMAMATARVEPEFFLMGFCTEFTPLQISPKDSLSHVCRYMNKLHMGGTDCSLPMKWALDNKVPNVEAFFVYTDNETWAGHVHPHVMLKNYQQKFNDSAKLGVIGMTSTGFTIAEPSNPRMLDVVGFDTAAPNLLADFASRS